MDNPKFIYSSSPDRGLDTLLQLWPFILNEFPGATLGIYYGFENLEKSIASSDDENRKKWMNSIKKDMEQKGVTYYGRIGQDELAERFLEADIWLYVTRFTETYCITALEAQLSETVCICTNLAALEHTVGDRGILLEGDAYTKEYREKALEETFAILRDDDRREALLKRAKAWAKTQTWKNRAKEWLHIFDIAPNPS